MVHRRNRPEAPPPAVGRHRDDPRISLVFFHFALRLLILHLSPSIPVHSFRRRHGLSDLFVGGKRVLLGFRLLSLGHDGIDYGPAGRLPPSRPCGYDAGVGRCSGAIEWEVTVGVQAYILIQTEVGKAAQVVNEVKVIGGVTEAEDVTGPYDLIVRAEAANVDELGKLVVAKIQAVEGITRTLTCPVVHL